MDPLGVFGGMPLVPPWAVPFGLQPPYPGGSFDEYLDPHSPHYRADVVAALTEARRREEQARAERREIEEREAAVHRARYAAVKAADGPLERAAALVELGSTSDFIRQELWDTWRELRTSGTVAPTHQLVQLRIKWPFLRGRFGELERRPAWQHDSRPEYVDDRDEVWVDKDYKQPVRVSIDPWFAVEYGAPVEASIARTYQSQLRYTRIRGKPLSQEEGDWRHAVILGVLRRVVSG